LSPAVSLRETTRPRTDLLPSGFHTALGLSLRPGRSFLRDILLSVDKRDIDGPRVSVLELNTRAPLERERLILEQLPQVKLIARRIHEKIQGRVDLDDLVSAGT